MQANLYLLGLLVLLYTTLVSSQWQSINIGGFEGESRRIHSFDDTWRDSAHNADVDKVLDDLKKWGNSGDDSDNFGNRHTGNSNFDSDRSAESFGLPRGFQQIINA
ncbi:hypothetical protein KR018_012264 [Drosophila ironensis]|nr:hypothetical protein KR018_012264 [Drosophila ironensis]